MSFSDCPHPRSDLIVTERSKPTHKHDIHSNNNNNKNNNNKHPESLHIFETNVHCLDTKNSKICHYISVNK